MTAADLRAYMAPERKPTRISYRGNRVYGMALRGFAGAGQNMYIYPSIFREFGGSWFQGNKVVVNTPEAVRALDWYVDILSKYAPPAVRNWNW